MFGAMQLSSPSLMIIAFMAACVLALLDLPFSSLLLASPIEDHHYREQTGSEIHVYAWKAHSWFRQDDLLFVQYKGRNGLPGAPLTVIRLAQSP